MYSNKRNWLSEFASLIEAIPNDWLHIIKLHNNPVMHANMDECIVINKLVKMKTTNIYSSFVNEQFIQPQSICKWNNIFNNEEINWSDVWIKKVKNEKNKKYGQLNYKLLNNIVPTNMRLYKWKLKNSNKCHICDVIEDEQHMFFECERNNILLKKIDNIFTPYSTKLITVAALLKNFFSVARVK